MITQNTDEIMRKIETVYPEGSEIVMSLAEKFREEGMREGMALGEMKSLIKTTIRLLTKKFGRLPKEVKSAIEELDVETLEIVTVEVF